MNIKLVSLTLKNFKGIKDLNVNFGSITNIKGRNKTGKTSIFDAFLWLLFDKDSTDRKEFAVKTYDENNNIIHGLDHEVEAVLDVDGKRINLKKTLREKWTKKRGEAEKVLTGNTTEYHINEVPIKKGEYVNQINQIVDENIFKLISNPLYFNTFLNWKERRDILLEVVGDISDEEVVSSKNELQNLQELLNGQNVDDFKKAAAAKRKKLNDEIKTIPIRIDEINLRLDTTNYDFTLKKDDLRLLERELQEIEEALTDKSKLFELNTKKYQELSNKKMEFFNHEDDLKIKSMMPFKVLQREIGDLKSEIKQAEGLIEHTNVDYLITRKEDAERRMQELRSEWMTKNEEAVVIDESRFVCPTCERDLETEDIERKREEMLANFNRSKAKELATISLEGSRLKKVKEGHEILIAKQKNEIETMATELDALRSSLEHKIEKLEKMATAKPALDEKWHKLQSEIELLAVEKDLDLEEAVDLLQTKKRECRAAINEITVVLQKETIIESDKKRIKELLEKERNLAQQIAELEGQEHLCDEFIRTKVDMLDDKINSKFSAVKFKLFNTLINGALEECCETLIDGVPFADANNAAKYNAGIDIINTLTEFYEVSAPIFIDNREGINRLINTRSQLINLIVSLDKELKVEIENSKEEVA
ncbi:MAG: hypothetical protein ACLKAK_07175 [Alkaliphilus sp.]